MSYIDTDSMLLSNFKKIINKIEKSLKTAQSSQPSNILVIFDSLNVIMNSCLAGNELDFIEIMNELL